MSTRHSARYKVGRVASRGAQRERAWYVQDLTVIGPDSCTSFESFDAANRGLSALIRRDALALLDRTRQSWLDWSAARRATHGSQDLEAWAMDQSATILTNVMGGVGGQRTLVEIARVVARHETNSEQGTAACAGCGWTADLTDDPQAEGHAAMMVAQHVLMVEMANLAEASTTV